LPYLADAPSLDPRLASFVERSTVSVDSGCPFQGAGRSIALRATALIRNQPGRWSCFRGARELGAAWLRRRCRELGVPSLLRVDLESPFVR
jgi:hypothetical protein